MSRDYPLTKSDVTVLAISEECHECDRRPATHVVAIDFRGAGIQHSVGRYCRTCAKKAAERIQDGLPA